MSLFKYEVFHKVVELGSLTRAAEVLGLTQSGVSHAVHSLETEFGFTILTRNRSGVRLTDNGERVLAFVREMLQVQERLKQEVAAMNGLETGTIRIGTFTSISVQWLPGIIRDFLASHPRIEVNLYEGDYHEIEEWLLSGEIDFGFVSMPTLDSFEVIPLKLDRMLCILPPGHRLEKEPCIRYGDIANEPFIMPKEGSDYDVRRVLRKGRVKPPVKFRAADDYAIVAMVENGLGISILPEMILRGRRNEVVALELEDGSCRSLGIALNATKNVSPATRKMIDCTRSWLADEARAGERNPQGESNVYTGGRA
ncbi:DNA-binding transcriptional LysR family regulator [Paenibacillus rhizosphaerae]|uniref:DNA-binding transcriptional LysR family regulator n=1 Tax=Paenibacillus rhizosphaerae TaxID=297318 RepID=A0A839THT5_9BACL|nr:LysR family transcriptional regulator [Paenibacillus rhizosphaerae]MBB3126251.1 DNA-binding transcriptional LysR family regulator [Paenibacillus rhizosphaerae]